MLTNKIEQEWVENFKKSALVNSETGVFNSKIAHQLFYGKYDDNYPSDYPHDFLNFYNICNEGDRNVLIENLSEYLHFIGIKIRLVAIKNHISKFPDDYTKLTNKCYFIFKTLAHYADDLNINNPYYDNNGDLFFLLRIESEESINGGQLNLFEDIELPDLYSKFSNLPEGYENDPEIIKLFDQIENSNNSFFITGKAGTGKSTFVHYFAQKTSKKVLLTAFTGIAAINVGGQTIHSLFRFPLKPLLPQDDEITIFREFTQKYKLLQKTDTIIIDEVSMLRSDILEAIDYSLRRNGGDPNKKFGGKQLIFIGDIFQLPPVVDSTDEVERFLFSKIYNSEYFFDSPAYIETAPQYFEFKKSHRQKDDMPFVELLDKVRTCEVNELILGKLNDRYDPTYIPKNDEFVINLTVNNAIANAENNKKLMELPYSNFKFEAKIEGEFSPDKYPTSISLELKKNAQVIFIKNDSAKRWVNGTIAKIDFISGDLIEIRLQDKSIHRIESVTWENRKYKYNKEKKQIVSEVVGTFTQFPIKLAWAITVHKSQGLAFDNVNIDLGTGAFVNGQVYTALSRCRTLQGITLKRKLRKEDIIADSRIIDFHKKNAPQSILEILLLDIEFTLKLLSLHYQFTNAEIIEYWDRLIKGDAHYSLFFSDTDQIITPKFGLCFNKHIAWTPVLRHNWMNEFQHLQYDMEGWSQSFNTPIGTIDGLNYNGLEIDDSSLFLEKLIPLNVIFELNERNDCIVSHWSSVLAAEEDWENNENFIGPQTIDIDTYKTEIPPLNFVDFKNLYTNKKNMILLNESVWDNTLSSLFSSEDVRYLIMKSQNQ